MARTAKSNLILLLNYKETPFHQAQEDEDCELKYLEDGCSFSCPWLLPWRRTVALSSLFELVSYF